MEDIIQIKDKYYILAASSASEEEIKVLKYGDLFVVLGKKGNINPFGLGNHGLYFEDTRFLSSFVVKIENKHLHLLSSLIRETNERLTIDLTNPDIELPRGLIKKGTIHFSRSIFLKENNYYERIKIANYGLEKIKFHLVIEYDADFIDIFEVRGVKRKKRGYTTTPLVYENSVTHTYKGLDGVTRKTKILFQPQPSYLDTNYAKFEIKLDPHESKDFYITISCQSGDKQKTIPSYREANRKLATELRSFLKDSCHIETTNEQFNGWINRSSSDLLMMLTKTPEGFYPYAGIPWFNTVFGRDGIITALQTLWIHPHIAKGVLGYLAAHQAKEVIPQQEAEPGKILHEQRKGEMANLGEVPFGLYYGSIDSTPLFLALAGRYLTRTNDLDFISTIWPSLELALLWIDTYGDIDGDGFIEYNRKSERGLLNQGWKDSEDSVFHSDGTIPKPPIALCEVQGYVYDAKIQVAKIALALGKKELSERLLKEAYNLKKKFNKAFWCEDIGTFALALDGDKKPCKVKTSNAGHCLFSGIAENHHAFTIKELLMGSHFFSGWGIRTLSSSEIRYNPMSYHNGSVWPHDNSIIALGLSRYGYKTSAAKILSSMFDASLFVESSRLPELMCGFRRRACEGPTIYPSACSPQTWASASIFMLLQASLGMSIDAKRKRIYFTNPVLPSFLEEVKIKNLRIGEASIDILLEYYPGNVGIKITKREGDVDVIIVK